MPIDREMDKENAVHIYDGILCVYSVMSDSANPWTVTCQDHLEFSRQEYWSELPFPSPGDLPNTGIEPRSPTLQADALPSEPSGKPYTVTRLRNKEEQVGNEGGVSVTLEPPTKNGSWICIQTQILS